MPYIIDETKTVRVSMFNHRQHIAKIMTLNDRQSGLSEVEVGGLRDTYGLGTMVIHKPNCLELFLREILRPLYLFVLFSVFYWYFQQGYIYYAITIFFVSISGLLLNLYQMVQLNNKIFSMAYYEIPVNALRNGVIIKISSLDVVPGDIIFLKDPIKIPF